MASRFSFAQERQALQPVEPNNSQLNISLNIDSEDLRKQFIETEYAALALPQGMYVTPSQARPFDIWNGLLCIRSGLYSGSIFKFNIYFSSQYPNMEPSIFFQTPFPLHFMVCQESGQFLAKSRDQNHSIVNILDFIHKAFMMPEHTTKMLNHVEKIKKQARRSEESLGSDPENLLSLSDRAGKLKKQDIEMFENIIRSKLEKYGHLNQGAADEQIYKDLFQ